MNEGDWFTTRSMGLNHVLQRMHSGGLRPACWSSIQREDEVWGTILPPHPGKIACETCAAWWWRVHEPGRCVTRLIDLEDV